MNDNQQPLHPGIQRTIPAGFRELRMDETLQRGDRRLVLTGVSAPWSFHTFCEGETVKYVLSTSSFRGECLYIRPAAEEPALPAAPVGSQNERVLARLRKNLGEWVPMPVLSAASGAFAVHSRISDLRKQGHRIEHKSERKPGSRANHSFYRLLQ